MLYGFMNFIFRYARKTLDVSDEDQIKTAINSVFIVSQNILQINHLNL